MKRFLRILAIVDIIFLVLMIMVGLWWKNNRGEPGLAEMLNIRSVNVAIIFLALIVITVVISMLVLKFRK